MSTSSVAALFAGIGGIELGLQAAGFGTVQLCESDPSATTVLRHHYPDLDVAPDVRRLEALDDVDVVTAGFPCQDLSQAGPKGGIVGSRSSLVGEVFRLLNDPRHDDTWLVLENVSYMLSLDQGRAMGRLTDALDLLGWTWAYRTIDARAFGLAQRRRRVFLVASRTQDPRPVLFGDDGPPPGPLDVIGPVDPRTRYGFYWTEGLRGLGWAAAAVPTIKGGSGLGIASPPAIWSPSEDLVGTPDIEALERLQGFPRGWTQPPGEPLPRGARHRLVGNAVAVPVARWIGERLQNPHPGPLAPATQLSAAARWPGAAWGRRDERYRVDISEWPRQTPYRIDDVLDAGLTPLSARATAGFLSRAQRGRLRFADGFLPSLQRHLGRRRVRENLPAPRAA